MPDKDPKKSELEASESEAIAKTPSSPLIFISHDTRDAELAEAFAKLVSSVSCGMLKCFRSSDKKGSQGIEYGLEWYPQLMGKLSSSSGVVCLLTERSLDRPWILYEAGVAKGKLDTPVYGIALGISLSKANTGPFAQFQNCDDDDESLTNLVMLLLSRIPNSEPDRDAVAAQVRSFTQRKLEILKKLGSKGGADAPAQDTSVAKLFEEVKLIVQDLPSKVEGRLAEAVDPMRRRRMRRFHPMMMEEMSMMSPDGRSPVGVLMMFSVFRDDLPWLYDLGKDLYDAIRRGDRVHAEETAREIERVVKMVRHHPMMEEMMMMGSKDTFMFLHELPHVIERFLHMTGVRRRSPRKDPESEEKGG
jgi:hypothetical protein